MFFTLRTQNDVTDTTNLHGGLTLSLVIIQDDRDECPLILAEIARLAHNLALAGIKIR
jgi:hypothetical protein